MRRVFLVSALLLGCSPLVDAGVRSVGIDLSPVVPVEADDLGDLDVDAVGSSTGRIEAQPIYDDGSIEVVGFPPAPEGRAFFGVLGFAEEPRADLVHHEDEDDMGPSGFAWDAVVGPLRREEDGHTSLLFLASDVDPYDLGALRTALIVVTASTEPTPDDATILLAGEFEFVETGVTTEGHGHGP